MPSCLGMQGLGAVGGAAPSCQGRTQAKGRQGGARGAGSGGSALALRLEVEREASKTGRGSGWVTTVSTTISPPLSATLQAGGADPHGCRDLRLGRSPQQLAVPRPTALQLGQAAWVTGEGGFASWVLQPVATATQGPGTLLWRSLKLSIS